MDPKSIANLDPKLRETYERVMGTTSGSSSPTAAPAATTPTPPDAAVGASPVPPTPPPAIDPAIAAAQAVSAADAIPPTPPAPPPDPFATGVATPPAPAAAIPPALDSGLSAPIRSDTPMPQAPNDPAAALTSSPASVFNTSTSFGVPASGAATPSPLDAGLGGTIQPLPSPAQAQTGQSTSSLIKILYIFGGIVFFVVYIFFWIKIFNYTLPFSF
jgi:hypothetical protein